MKISPLILKLSLKDKFLLMLDLILPLSSVEVKTEVENKLLEIYDCNPVLLPRARDGFFWLVDTILSSGDEVVLSRFGYAPFKNYLERKGVICHIVDDQRDNSTNVTLYEKYINDRTKLVIYTQIFGDVKDLSSLYNFLKEKEIYLFEDRAQGFGSNLPLYGQASILSFSTTKYPSSLGGGGRYIL